MDPPSYTTLNNAQVPTDPEKGQLQDSYNLAAQHADYGTVYLPGQSIPAPQDQRTQRWRGRRFWVRLFHWTMLEILFFSVLLYTFGDLRSFVLGVRNVFIGGPSDIAMNDHEVHLPHDCIEVLEWDHIDVPGEHDGYSHVARTSLDLPIASDLLYFIGRGRLSHGVVRFVDSEAQDSDQASVEVNFLYNEHELSDHLKICRLHKEDSKNGVGIFSPEWSHHPGNQRSNVVVEVKLPRAAAIKSLETFLPLFLHDVGDFRDSVTFDTISLTSSNLPIVARYLTANWTNLRTSNSHISGIFNSPQAIDISTSNSYIEGEFNLSHDGADSTPSRINLHTSNAPIKAQISLTSTADNQKNGSFDIITQTNNSPFNIKFDTAPIDSRVVFKGRTSNAPAAATLHETFEGTFSVDTGRWFEAGVHVVNTEDPSGEGRQRYMSHYGSGRGHDEGKVSWGDASGKKLGHVELATTNSPVQLYL